MTESGRILIADDEPTFLHSTADLLRAQGYHCECAPDADTAADILKRNTYDLLIADIRMPGNPQLELVQDLDRVAAGMPVILVTAYPSLPSAIQSVRLPVAAYLIKPVEFEQLLIHVRAAVARSRLYRTVTNARQRLEEWQTALAGLDTVFTTAAQPPAGTGDAFVQLTFNNIVAALTDLKQLTQAHVAQKDMAQTCHLFNCPRLTELSHAILETVTVLGKTKHAFKSKDLGNLRRRLEQLLNKPAQPHG